MTPKQVKSIKEASGLTWAEFAAKVGVSEKTAKNWCTPKNPNKPNRFVLPGLKRLEKKYLTKGE